MSNAHKQWVNTVCHVACKVYVLVIQSGYYVVGM